MGGMRWESGRGVFGVHQSGGETIRPAGPSGKSLVMARLTAVSQYRIHLYRPPDHLYGRPADRLSE